MASVAITEAESVVMAVLWRRGPMPPKSLLEEVGRDQPWGAATVKTLLNRLMHKGAVRSDRTAGMLLYVPQVSRDDYLRHEVKALVDRLFGGDPDRLALFLKDQAVVSVFDPASTTMV